MSIQVKDRELEGIKEAVKKATGKDCTDDAANQLRKELTPKDKK